MVRPRGRNSRFRYVLNILISLPLFAFFFSAVFPALLGVLTFNIPSVFYAVLILISFMSYALSLHIRKSLYIEGDIPADTSMFVSELLLFPLLLAYPSLTTASRDIFAVLDSGIMIAASVFAIVGTTIKAKEFPKLDSETVFFLSVFTVLSLAVFGSVLLASNLYVNVGFAVSYLSIFMLFNLSIYTAQLLAYKEHLELKRLLV